MGTDRAKERTARERPRVTTSQLRDAMPSKRTPGKTSARDPAMASFDTDDEAAGRPPTSEAIERELARTTETRDTEKHPEGARAGLSAATARVLVTTVVLLAIVAVVIIIVNLS